MFPRASYRRSIANGPHPTHLNVAFVCIHAFLCSQSMDARDIGERSNAVLRTAVRGYDVERPVQTNWKPL